VNVKSIEKKEKNTADLVIHFSAEEFDKAVNGAYLKNKSKLAVPGFRKGHVPRKIIESMYGKEVFYEDAIETLYPQGISCALDSGDLKIVGRPSVSDFKLQDDKSVDLTYLIALYPEVTLGEYKGIKAPKRAVEVTEDDVNADIEGTRKRNARIQTVERPAQDGDTVNIDFEGFLDGKPFDGGKGEGFDLVLGSNQFVPGFEEQVIGMAAGDEKDLDITFPENYHEGLAGKAVVFHVKVNKVSESILPDLDDEFVKDVSELNTLDEYKASVKERLEKQKTAESDAEFREAVMNKVLEGVTVEIPDAMVEEQIDNMISNYSYNLSAQGMSFEKYLQMMGMTVENYRTYMRPVAEKQLKTEVTMRKIAETENFEITADEVEAEYKAASERYSTPVEELKKVVGEEAIKNQLKLDKAEALVYSSAEAE
jgi:trigger factor